MRKVDASAGFGGLHCRPRGSSRLLLETWRRMRVRRHTRDLLRSVSESVMRLRLNLSHLQARTEAMSAREPSFIANLFNNFMWLTMAALVLYAACTIAEALWRHRPGHCESNFQDDLNSSVPSEDPMVEKCTGDDHRALCFVRRLENGIAKTRPIRWDCSTAHDPAWTRNNLPYLFSLGGE